MDSRGFEDSGLGERYSYAAEPDSDEASDPLPLRRPGLDYVFRAADEGPLALSSRPHEAPPPTSEHQAWIDETGYDPDRYPTEPYLGSPRVGRPYVTHPYPLRASGAGGPDSTTSPDTTSPDGTGPDSTGNGSASTGNGSSRYGREYSGAGSGDTGYSGAGFGALAPEPTPTDRYPGGYDDYPGGYDDSRGYDDSSTTYGGSSLTYGDAGTTYGGSSLTYGDAGTTYGGASPAYGDAGTTYGRASIGYGYDGGEVESPTFGARSRYDARGRADTGTFGAHRAIESSRPYQAQIILDESDRYESGRPGYDLSEELAEQRRRDTRRDETEREQDEQRHHMPLWQELPLLLVVAFCVAVLIRSFLVQAFFIPSSSMEQTLLIGDRVLVNKVLYDLREPRRGEVVVFRGTDRWAPENFDEEPGGLLDRIGDTLGDLVGVSRPGEKDFIKRVIGLPGDHVACCDDGRVTVNGVPIDEPYINANSPLDVPPSANFCGARRFEEVIVPAGQLFVMGDNRAVSQDSRCQGPVPIANVIGRAFMVVWPSDRWSTISATDVFDAVPAPAALGWPDAGGPDRVPADPLGAVVALPLLAAAVGSSRSGQRHRWEARRLRR